MRSIVAVAAASSIVAPSAFAQVVTDGSLGVQTSVPGPTFFIDDTLGQTRGANLFHSFNTFNVGANQNAIFDSALGVSNIIARVTGAAPSNINGTLSANANLFLLNPNGVLLGSGATLNVTGSVRLSTADYLRLGATERFYANLGQASTLSFAAPSAFGFLDGSVGPISATDAVLFGSSGRSLSFIGGNLAFTNTTVSVEHGRIDFAAVASAGEVTLAPSSLDSTTTAMGTLTLAQSLFNPFDEPGTSIYIRAGQFVASDSSLLLATAATATQHPTIDINVGRLQLRSAGIASMALNDATGPNIRVRADQVMLTDSSAIISTSDSAGAGGNVNIEAREVTMQGGYSLLGSGSVGGMGGAGDLTIEADLIDIADGGLSTVTGGPGAAGDILITADRMIMRRNVGVTSGTTAGGNGGRVVIDARELSLEGDAAAHPVITATTNALVGGGAAGSIEIDVDSLRIRDGAITSSTSGNGAGGRVVIDARSATLEQNAAITSETGVVGALGPASVYGSGGTIAITAGSLQLSTGARISTNTFANGAGGAIAIDSDRVVLNGSTTAITASTGSALTTTATGAAGSIVIDAAALELQERATIGTSTFGPGQAGRIEIIGGSALLTNGTSLSASSFGQSANAGAANDIRIDLDSLGLSQGAQISNATHGPGAAGRLLIYADSVSLDSGGLLQVSSLGGGANAGRVGDLYIEADRVALDGGSIQARGSGGAAPGSIAVVAQTLTLDHSSILSAVSTGTTNAGNIALSASQALDIRGFSQISTEANRASGGNIALLTDGILRMQGGFVSTSVLGGNTDSGSVLADSGNVLIDATLLLLDDSAITARAVSGVGGRIDIGSTFLLRSTSTLLDASSSLGVDGEVTVAGFDIDLNSDIAPLPADFLDAQRWLSQPCSSRLGTDVNRLTIAGRSGAYRVPSDFIPSPLPTDEPSSRAPTATSHWNLGTSALLAAVDRPCR